MTHAQGLEVIERDSVQGLGLVAPVQEERSDETRQWTIKGLSPTTVEVTREAAKRSGMRLNSWISQVLEAAAQDDAHRPTKVNDDVYEPTDLKTVEAELVKMRAKTEQLENTVGYISSLLLKLLAEKS